MKRSPAKHTATTRRQSVATLAQTMQSVPRPKPAGLRAVQDSEFEAALRRHLSRRELRDITTKPQIRPLVIPFSGTKRYPGRPCFKDLEANEHILRAVVEVWPDRIPSVYVVASGVERLDEYYQGDVLQYESESGGFAENGFMECSVSVAACIKVLVQRLRRLFRRSTCSRSSQRQLCCTSVRFQSRLRPGAHPGSFEGRDCAGGETGALRFAALLPKGLL